MQNQNSQVRLAAVQAASVHLDLDGSVEKACQLIREAGRNGANIIAFPESFIPAHPLWYHFHPATGLEARKLAVRLFKNSVEIPGPATDALCKAAAEAGVFVVMGLCEREHGRLGTMYNTMLFIDQTGRIVGRHRKLVPTLGERMVHAPGDAAGVRAYPTPWGSVGGSICGENSNPLPSFILDVQGVNIHVAQWPAHFTKGLDMRDQLTFITRGLAYRMKAFVINAMSEVSDEMMKDLPVTDDDREFLKKQTGGVCIIGPTGNIVAGPMPPGEGILYADVNLDDCVGAKLTHDFGGHYNRFDLFDLQVRSAPWSKLRHISNGESASVGPDGLMAPREATDERER